MRVLLLSFHYPPDPAVGSVRAARVAEAFAAAGHEVDVVAARLPQPDGPQTFRAPPQRVRVHRVLRLPNPREIALGVRGRLRRRSRTPAQGSVRTGWIVPAHVPRWKRFLVAMALLPDSDQGFIVPAVTRALRLARGIDLLYTSGPPHSAHVAGLMVKRLTGLRWAAEFRDPWTDNAVQPRYAVSESAFAIKTWLERRTLRAADHLVAVSDAAARLFRAKIEGDGAGRVIVVRNGIPDAPPLAPPPTPTPVRVLYLGSLYHGRDPRPFLQALATLRSAGHEPALRTVVDFYGDCRIFRGLSVQGFIDELGLHQSVRLHDPVPRHHVPALMTGAHLLLLLAQEQPLQVPAKLYEYLGSRRPLLAFADAEGETAHMLRQVGGHFLVTDTSAECALRVVRAALEAPAGAAPIVNEALLDDWSARRQMATLIEHVAPPGHRK